MRNFGYVLATQLLVEEKKLVGFMYHEKGEGDDSGWRFFTGEEDQAYVDNPENIKIYDIQTILDIDQSIRPYLKSKEYTAFERIVGTNRFKMAEDYNFGISNGGM